jgi:hypothetical protein
MDHHRHPRRRIDHRPLGDERRDRDVPATYVSEFVQLAYATTEHGNQGITTDQSITLVTGTTTGRGLYVGATRGRDVNQFLVVTDQHSERRPWTSSGGCSPPTGPTRLPSPTAGTSPNANPHRHPKPRRRAFEPAWLNEWQNDVRERVPMIDDSSPR